MGVISRGVRNTFRNGIRTFSIVIILGLSIGLAITMLIARQAVQAKIDSVKSSIGNTISVSPAGARGFQGGGTPLTADEIAKVSATAHVVSVTTTLQDRLTSSNTNLVSSIDPGTIGRRFGGGGAGGPGGNAAAEANFTLPVTVTGTNDPSSVSTLGGGPGGGGGGGTVKITSGQSFDGKSDTNVALVGQDLATKNNLKVGSTFTAYGTAIQVVGIFDAGNTFSNSGLLMPIAAVQRLSQQPGVISSATVQVDSITNLEGTTTAIKNTLGTTVADVVSQQDTSAQALAPLDNIKSISLYSLIGAVGAGAAIILLTMLMIVRERRREIGVMKAIGAQNLKITAQFMVEAVTFTLMGAGIGFVIGVIAGNPVTKLLVANSAQAATAASTNGRGFGRAFRAAGTSITNIQTTVGWEILLWGLLAAIVIAVVGSAIPAWLISKVRPAEVMRAE